MESRLPWSFLDGPQLEVELPAPEELEKCLTLAQRAFLTRTAREQGSEAAVALEKRLRGERSGERSEEEHGENLLEKHFEENSEMFDGEERGWLRKLFQRAKERQS